MVRSKIYLILAVGAGISHFPVCYTKSTVFEQNSVKIDFFDYVKSPDEPVVKVADGSNRIFAKHFTSCRIRPVLVKITNQGTKPIMVNSRSIKAPIISTKKAVRRLQRSYSITGYPYLESWGVYAVWVVIAGIIDFDLGWPDITKIELFKKYVSLKIPPAPDRWQQWAEGVRDWLNAKAPRLFNDAGVTYTVDRFVSGYCSNFFNRVIPLRVLSLVAAIMSSRYLSSIKRNTEKISVLGKIMSGQGLRLLYPAIIQPQQTMQKMILVDTRSPHAPTAIKFDVFAYNNQDIIASFEYTFDDMPRNPGAPA